MEIIAVIGAGMMGPGIAQVFAAHGHPVEVYARTAEKIATVKDRVRVNLKRMADYGLVESSDISPILDRIAVTTELPLALRRANVVIKAITEDLGMKQELFAELDRLCPAETILCSNTSVMSITRNRRQRQAARPDCRNAFLSASLSGSAGGSSAHRIRGAYGCGIRSVEERRQSAGARPARRARVYRQPHAACAMARGVGADRRRHMRCRDGGDLAISNSFGLRLPVLGPVANADLVGLDLTLAIHDYVLPHLNVSAVPCDTLRNRVKEGKLGFKTKGGFLEWTDESMAATREKLMTYLLEVAARAKEVQ